MPEELQISRTNDRLVVRNSAPSWLSGLAIVAFYCLFAGVAVWSWRELAPETRGEQLLWTGLPVAAFGLLMLWLAVFAVSHQQLTFDRHGAHYSRRVGSVSIWRRTIGLADFVRAKSGFQESASDQPDVHWLEIETKGSPLRLKTLSNVDALCQEINRTLASWKAGSR